VSVSSSAQLSSLACVLNANQLTLIKNIQQFGFPTVDTKIPEILNFGAKNKKKNRIKARKLRVANRGVAG